MICIFILEIKECHENGEKNNPLLLRVIYIIF